MVFEVFYRFALILQLGPQSDGGVGQHVEERELTVGIANHGRVMSGITVFEQTALHVKPADEQGDKHALLIVF